LIDTGASITAIDREVLRQLKSPPAGQVSIATPSSANTVQASTASG
jgi:predicted aspartyl protease